MGLFSRKVTTHLSSVVYPLGEDDEDRVDFLKYTVLNANLQGRPIGESITQGYLRGQGVALRNAFHYARDKYTHGVPTSAARYLERPDTALITPILQPKFPGAEIVYLTTVVGSADFEWWAEQFLTETYGYDRTVKQFSRPPTGVDANAAVAYDLEPSGLIRILLMNANGNTLVVDHRPTGYVEMATSLHCCYKAKTVFIERDDVVTREATPGEIDSVSVSLTVTDRINEIQERQVRIETDILEGVATVSTRIQVTLTSRPQYLLYRLGTGTYPALDAWLQSDTLDAPYYPSVPLRVDNKDVVSSEASKATDLYKTSKKLLNKVGADLDKLGKQVNTNPSVKDIDFAFVAFGVALNTKSQEGKRYLFRFFDYLRDMSTGGVAGAPTSTATKSDWTAWATAFAGGQTSTVPKVNAIEIFSEKERAKNHDIRIQWDYIDTSIKPGTIFPGAKRGDVDVTMSGIRIEYALLSIDKMYDSSKLFVRKQLDADSYVEMEISGLVHENYIYQGKATVVTAYDAFYEAGEEGFLIPLNQQIIRATPLVELTDLSYQCTHIVFNCYQVVKQKWYQTTLFKIILVIISIIIIFCSWGTATPAVTGFWGAIATFFAISVTLVMVLAATVYVLAMMLIMNLLMKVAIKAFGPKWGPVIAAIIAIVSMNWESLATIGSTIATTGITATMIMQATLAALQVYGAYAQGQLSAVQKKMMGLETEFDRKMKEIEDLSKANLDTNTDLIDIYGMTRATNLQFESAEAFLGRTLIVGSDVAAITNGLIENLVDVGLQLPATG